MPYKKLNPKKKHTYKQYRDAGYSVNLAKTMIKIDNLNKGAKIEMEHTKDPKIAEKIASDHLKENPNYYKYSTGKGKEYLVKMKIEKSIKAHDELHPEWSKAQKEKSLKYIFGRHYSKFKSSSARNTRRQRKSSRLGEVY